MRLVALVVTSLLAVAGCQDVDPAAATDATPTATDAGPIVDAAPPISLATSAAVDDLLQISFLLRDRARADGAFPTESLERTPVAPCCNTPQHQCPFVDADWDRWREVVGFAPAPRPLTYRYRLVAQAPGSGVSIVATADLNCDGVEHAIIVSCADVNGVECHLTWPAHFD